MAIRARSVIVCGSTGVERSSVCGVLKKRCVVVGWSRSAGGEVVDGDEWWWKGVGECRRGSRAIDVALGVFPIGTCY